MAEGQSNPPQEGFKLPIELKTVLRTLQRKLIWLVAIGVLSALGGIAGALYLGTQNYEATTVLFYQPIESFVPDTFRVYQSVGEGTELTYEQGAGLIKFESTEKSLWNRVNMVKTLPNLELLRQELAIEKTLEQLGSSIRISVARDTNLMSISAQSEDPKEAALIANTMRDIFLQRDNRRIRDELQQKIRNLQQQYDVAINDLTSARKEFNEFVNKHAIKEIQTEAIRYASELVNLEISIARDRELISIYRQRVAKIKEAIEVANKLDQEEQERLKEEEQKLGLTPDEANNKIQQMLQRIEEIKSGKTFPIEKERLRTQLIIAENEYVKGLINRREYEDIKFTYESFLEENKPSIEIERLKQQIEDIRNMTFIGRGDSVASSEYLKLIRVMLLENELELISIENQYAVDVQRFDELKSMYSGLPIITQTYIVLNGRVSSLEAESRGLEKILSQYTMIGEKDQSDFYIINDAVPPLFPQESNRKLLAIAITFVLFLLGFTIILTLIVTDTRIKSAGDAKQKISMPVIASFPLVKYQQTLLPQEEEEPVQIELYRILCRPLRLSYPKRGATFLVTSTTKGEGKSTTAINLAMVFGRQDERVLLFDGQIRKQETASPFHTYAQYEGNSSQKGLGEYLSYRVFDYQEIITQTSIAGVDMILTYEEAVIPDLLQSARMRELMEELKEHYSIIIMEGPPVLECVDSEILTNYADTILFVTACDTMKPQKINQCIKRLKHTSIPIEGVILTKVSSVYL